MACLPISPLRLYLFSKGELFSSFLEDLHNYLFKFIPRALPRGQSDGDCQGGEAQLSPLTQHGDLLPVRSQISSLQLQESEHPHWEPLAKVLMEQVERVALNSQQQSMPAKDRPLFAVQLYNLIPNW